MRRWLPCRPTLFFLCLTISAVVVLQPAHAQNFQVIHTFTGSGDGAFSTAGLTLDAAGNLYGTTEGPDYGNVFRLKRVNGSWVLNTLFTFNGNDGGAPMGRVVFGPRGGLYGTTYTYGLNDGGCDAPGCGVVYSITTPANICRSISCSWNQTVAHYWNGYPDGSHPYYVDPAFDSSGNLYGTTFDGGSNFAGTVFQLSYSGGQWTENIIHNFTGDDGQDPASGVILDPLGNVYGTTWTAGAHGGGIVYELSPAGGIWTMTTLYDFPNSAVDGRAPLGPLLFDRAGNLYGTASDGGPGGGGTVFELSPSGSSWEYTVLHSFPGRYDQGSAGNLVMDAGGNLYGVTYGDGGFGKGSVWKLSRNGGGWTYTDLHDFSGGIDGEGPIGGPVLDSAGNLYGTTQVGGLQNGVCQSGCGVVWEITP